MASVDLPYALDSTTIEGGGLTPTPPDGGQETPIPPVIPPVPALVPTATPRTLPCIVSITDPLNNARVVRSVSVRGTVTPACEDGPTLWLMVEIGNRMWPQEPLSPFPTGTGAELAWFANANVGVGGDAGKAFGLKVILANQQIEEDFTAWFLRGQRIGDWPGFIPPGTSRQGF